MSTGIIQKLGFKFLQKLEPEFAHNLTIKTLASNLLPNFRVDSYPLLKATLCGLDFPNPLAISAGFDKNGDVADVLLELGLGYVEVGTITPKPQLGNQKPRVFRLRSDQAIINRYGFNSEGHEKVHRKLQKQRQGSGIIGVNLGANKNSADRVNDYVLGLNKFSDVASYFVVNVSSPNTPGLRNLQSKDELSSLLETIMAELSNLRHDTGSMLPIFLKIAPDIDDSQLYEICQSVLKFKVNGLIISNTTLSRENLTDIKNREEIGGLSGKPLFDMSTRILAKARNIVGPDVVIIGVGGIDSGEKAWAKITAGANLLQLYTGLTYHGFDLITEILDYLSSTVELNRLNNLQQAVGINTKDWLTE